MANQQIRKTSSKRTDTASRKKTKQSLVKRPSKPILIDVNKSKKDYDTTISFLKRDLKATPKPFPSGLTPMLATLTKEPFNDADWLFEIKWDGYRSLAYLNKGTVQLRSRNNLSFNQTFIPVVDALKNWKINAVLDGEVVVLNEEGKADFQALQNYKTRQEGNIVYYVFDILWLDGIDLMKEPLYKRKQILQKLVPDSGIIRYCDDIEQYGKEFFDVAKQNDLEGIVAKHRNSIYLPGERTKKWLKMPTEIRQEFVVGGWTESENARSFKSLLFGYYEGEKFIYAGHAGGGYKEKEMPSILSKLKKLEIKKQPFEGKVDTDANTHWVNPELVIEVKYASLTASGKIRKPAIFLGFREDKKATEVKKEITIPKDETEVAEEAVNVKEDNSKSNWPELSKKTIENRATFTFDGRDVEVTNIDKKLWDDFTKAHLFTYYHSVYPFIIPHLKDRPLSLHIKHLGPTAPGLYIKDMEGHQPEWAQIYSIKRKHKAKGKREMIDYLVCNDEATLQYIINLGCIDVNPWTSRIVSPNNPDYVVIDLDPSDEDFGKAVETAKAAKEFFDKHKVTAFPKTSGKTGIHLYLPCSGFDFGEARTIAENICQGIHQLVPGITTTSISINQRGDKLYLDPNQNDFADTVAAPYSVRPYKQLQISTPLEWKEINGGLHPANFDIPTVLKRLKKKGDLWQDILSEKNRQTNVKGLKQFLL